MLPLCGITMEVSKRNVFFWNEYFPRESRSLPHTPVESSAHSEHDVEYGNPKRSAHCPCTAPSWAASLSRLRDVWLSHRHSGKLACMLQAAERAVVLSVWLTPLLQNACDTATAWAYNVVLASGRDIYTAEVSGILIALWYQASDGRHVCRLWSNILPAATLFQVPLPPPDASVTSGKASIILPTNAPVGIHESGSTQGSGVQLTVKCGWYGQSHHLRVGTIRVRVQHNAEHSNWHAT